VAATVAADSNTQVMRYRSYVVAFKLAKDELLKRDHLVLRARDHEDVVNVREKDAAGKRIYKYARVGLKWLVADRGKKACKFFVL
jgi:hypothetical protein